MSMTENSEIKLLYSVTEVEISEFSSVIANVWLQQRVVVFFCGRIFLNIGVNKKATKRREQNINMDSILVNDRMMEQLIEWWNCFVFSIVRFLLMVGAKKYFVYLDFY